jgi:hypothetical protein
VQVGSKKTPPPAVSAVTEAPFQSSPRVRALRRPQVLVRGSTSRHATGFQSKGDASCMRAVRSHRPAFYLESQRSDVAGDAQQVEPAARRLALIARALRRHGSSLHPATPADKSFDSISMLVSWNWAFRLLPHATSVDGSSPWAKSVLPAPSLRRTTPDPSAQTFLPLTASKRGGSCWARIQKSEAV